jgi:hypothetical protein
VFHTRLHGYLTSWVETEKGVVITSAVYSCVIFVDFENICLSNRLEASIGFASDTRRPIFSIQDTVYRFIFADVKFRESA